MQQIIAKKAAAFIGIFTMLVSMTMINVSASQEYSENILSNPKFSFITGVYVYPGWHFCSSGNYENARLDYISNVSPEADGWNTVTDPVGEDHMQVKADSNGLLIKNTVLKTLSQYSSRLGQVMDTIPGTVYRVSIPIELVESVGSASFVPRYAVAIEEEVFHGKQLHNTGWTVIPEEETTISFTFTAGATKTFLRLAIDSNGNGGVAGDYSIVRIHDPVVDAQLMETVVKGVYHKGLSDEKVLYSRSVFDINNSINSKSVSADSVTGYTLIEGQTTPQAYLPTEDRIIEFEYDLLEYEQGDRSSETTTDGTGNAPEVRMPSEPDHGSGIQSPETGNSSGMVLWIILATMSIGTILMTIRIRKSKRQG